MRRPQCDKNEEPFIARYEEFSGISGILTGHLGLQVTVYAGHAGKMMKHWGPFSDTAQRLQILDPIS